MPRIGYLGSAITLLFLLVALCGERLAPYPAGLADYEQILVQPSARHLMGTDHLGRDLFSRLIAGTRTTLGLALVVALINSALALVLGALCGFFGGWFDAILMRLVDALLALPGFLLAICFLGLFGGGVFQLVLYLVLTGWAQLARIVRNEIAVVSRLDFITANTAAGYSAARNLFLHALPAVLPSVLILLLNTLVGDVFAIVSLSFLGLGVSPQIPEWGTALFDARSFFLSSPWLFAFPSALIAGFTLGLHLLADGLREFLDKKRFLFAVEEVSLFAGAASSCGSDTP
jgi:ABC-type dipeptide/oligopeptide/nickel transport system permease subunit